VTKPTGVELLAKEPNHGIHTVIKLIKSSQEEFINFIQGVGSDPAVAISN
jgi:hypothetical protein